MHLAPNPKTRKTIKKRHGDVSPNITSSNITKQLLAWYDQYARDLPWRIAPGSNVGPEPYRIWLSEIMLQQTTVAAVKPYFAKFLERWPTVQNLAHADNDDVMAAWAGLGYYARARNLHACAKYVVEKYEGIFPAAEADLRTLPGVGTYTAAAIAAIAFGERAVVVDANVERVVARLFALETPLPAAKKEIAALADTITPALRAGDFAQAMMDLGATICTSKTPQCLLCPLSNECEALSLGLADQLPRKAPKKAKPQKQGWLWWIERDGAVLLVKRPDKGMLGGMMAFPGSDWEEGDLAPLNGDGWKPTGHYVQHSFTHFDLKMHIVQHDGTAMPRDGIWWPVDALADAGLPTLYKKAVTAMSKIY